MYKCVPRSVCEQEHVWKKEGAWVARRATRVSRSFIFVTHQSAGEERRYLTPLPDLLPFFLACVPLSPPHHATQVKRL